MVTVNFRGGEEEKRKAFGLVVAEAIKVSDQGGAQGAIYDYAPYGTKAEIQLESKYVGWVKGPRGKVIQDISTRSSTRVDMDQSNPEFAVVKIYGTYDGVQNAKELVAHELSKVSPEAAAEITGGSFSESFSPPSMQGSQPPQMGSSFGGSSPDLSSLTSALASVLGGGGGDPSLSGQQAAAAQLTQNFLQQLSSVAPNLVGGDFASRLR
mmetsp:Transcript_74826/g.242967  ORF Transcript_74826/g.242967 Transcript_74826/m.242967 type:complete len:210 (+) Transcript_74826:65-694(+)